MDTRFSIQFDNNDVRFGDTHGNRLELGLDRRAAEVWRKDARHQVENVQLSCANGVRVVASPKDDIGTVALNGQDVTERVRAAPSSLAQTAIPPDVTQRFERAVTAMNASMSPLSVIGHAASLAITGQTSVNIGQLESPLTPVCDGAKEAIRNVLR